MPPSNEAYAAYLIIQKLNADDIAWLRNKLSQLWDNPDEEGGAPVREPRRPLPESPGDTIALSTPQGEQ